MRPFLKKHFLAGLFFSILTAYLLSGTGLFSDDYTNMDRVKGKTASQVLLHDFYFIETPVVFFTNYPWYTFFKIDDAVRPASVKIVYTIAVFWMISLFFSLFMDRTWAHITSFVFIFFPVHDAYPYWFVAHYLGLSFGFYLFAYYLAQKQRPFAGLFFAFLGSFVSYGSTPIAVALALLFVLNREKIKALIMLVPNVIYSIYYMAISAYMHIGTEKVSSGIGPAGLLKNLAIQLATFADAFIGPSMWLKVFYSFFQFHNIAYMVFWILLSGAVAFWVSGREKPALDKKLLLCLCSLAVLSLAMFSLTGRYPQIAFNLGDRVTLFGSLAVSYFLIVSLRKRWARGIVLFILIFSIAGISSHWKVWTARQDKVVRNIACNHAISGLPDGTDLYVTGDQYSHFGRMSHIEFLSEGWVEGAIIAYLFDEKITGYPLNRSFLYKDGVLVDRKYGQERAIGDAVLIYDSGTDKLIKIPATRLNDYINAMPRLIRHWIMFPSLTGLRNLLVKVQPRLEYLL